MVDFYSVAISIPVVSYAQENKAIQLQAMSMYRCYACNTTCDKEILKSSTSWPVFLILPIGMDFPIGTTEKVQHVCAFRIDTMNFIFTACLKPILPIQLRISHNQGERCVFDLRPEEMALHSRCSSLIVKLKLTDWVQIHLKGENSYHSIKVIFLVNKFTSSGLIYDTFTQLKKKAWWPSLIYK